MKLNISESQATFLKPYAINRNYRYSILEVIEYEDGKFNYKYLSVSGPAEMNKKYHIIKNSPEYYFKLKFESGNSLNQPLLLAQYKSWDKFTP